MDSSVYIVIFIVLSFELAIGGWSYVSFYVIQSDALTIELLQTLWCPRVKCGSLTRTASLSHIVKSGQARMTHSCVTQSHQAYYRSSQRPTFHPCSPQSLHQLSIQSILLDHGGSWVRIPSVARIFSEFLFDTKTYHDVLLLLKRVYLQSL